MTTTLTSDLQLYTPEGGSDAAHNFYSIHVMSYCQGVLETVEPGETGVARNVTECSSRTIMFAFNPTDAWPEEITHGPTLEWPRVISDDFNAFSLTSRSMAVFYIIGVGAIGFALLSRVSSFITRKARTGLFEFGFLVVSHSVSWQHLHPLIAGRSSALSASASPLSLRRSSPSSSLLLSTPTARAPTCQHNTARSSSV